MTIRSNRDASPTLPQPVLGWRPWAERSALVGASALAALAFVWPVIALGVPEPARNAVPTVALVAVPLAALAALWTLDARARTPTAVAMLGVLTALGAAVRIGGAGVGGLEPVFILLILAGRAYGARFGFLLGMTTIGFSSLLFGGVGPWTPFQMFAAAWVAAGAGLLPNRAGWRRHPRLEVWGLAAYGALASYAFGAAMNLWFWPLAVGPGTTVSYSSTGTLSELLASFGLYTLTTSTLTWDTVRAVTTVLGIVLIGRAVLAALRRAPVGDVLRGYTEK